MSFKSIFLTIFISTSLLMAAVLFNSRRPAVETNQPAPEYVRATGKCAECHLHSTSAVVHQFEMSKHNAVGVTCLDCHAPADGQTEMEHRGFIIAQEITPKNCQQCHETEHAQFMQSRHAAPAWSAVTGAEDFSAEQIAFAEKFHPGAVDRPANKLAMLEGASAKASGCVQCHDIGRPNADGSIGSCTKCHARHSTSIELARSPMTCGQCHMGPDHSQIEIYNESKHGVIFEAQRHLMNLKADPKKLTTRDMSVPTCATCHMSGLEGEKVTHDVTERLSYWLFAPVSEKRPHYQMAQVNMKAICTKCHVTANVDEFYARAEANLEATNQKILKAKAIIDELRADGLLTPEPFDEPIEFLYFDIWHYYGRTAKHGAFMGGADFVQWHGNYEILHKTEELEEEAAKIREKHLQSE